MATGTGIGQDTGLVIGIVRETRPTIISIVHSATRHGQKPYLQALTEVTQLCGPRPTGLTTFMPTKKAMSIVRQIKGGISVPTMDGSPIDPVPCRPSSRGHRSSLTAANRHGSRAVTGPAAITGPAAGPALRAVALQEEVVGAGVEVVEVAVVDNNVFNILNRLQKISFLDRH